jgi:EAL domain-containing protein (putative c-di-GMP-specific phosphodiesterase class I)
MPERFTPEDYYQVKTDLLKLRSALHDPNTGLASYHARLGELRAHFDGARRMGVLVVSVGDLSHLESIYGWQVFDEVLRTVAATLEEMRGGALPADVLLALDAIGSERFVLFVPRDGRGGEVSPSLLEAMAAAVRSGLEEAFRREAFRSLAQRPRFRVGHALLRDDAFHRFERLVYGAVERARTGRDPGRERLRARCEEELRRILAEGEIQVVFQPIHALQGGEILGYEALARGPDQGPLRDPRRMFEISEDLGLGAALDAMCQRRAILAAGRLPPGRKLFVNALPSSVLDAGSGGCPPLDWIERAGRGPADVVIEITERGPREGREALAARVAALRDRGLGVALDDIGTGLTGLQAIREIGPDFLKLDVSLTHGIQSNLVTQDLLRSLAGVAKSIGARIVAEGVETEQEAATLRDCGADFGQGYLFARPSPGPAAPARTDPS